MFVCAALVPGMSGGYSVAGKLSHSDTEFEFFETLQASPPNSCFLSMKRTL